MTGDGPGNDNPWARPGFDEPWQAQAHAMSQVLLESGRIEANVWAETLGAAIRKRLASGAADTTETYYAALWGHQLLADALGGRVAPMANPDVGILKVDGPLS